MIRAVKIKVKGHVQGVSYRAETQEQALLLGLKGYAKNNTDGSVTVLAIGEETAIKKITEWCRNGPILAHVDNMEVTEVDVSPSDFKGFEIY